MKRLNVNFGAFPDALREKTPREYASLIYNEIMKIQAEKGFGHAGTVAIVDLVVLVTQVHDKIEAREYWKQVSDTANSDDFWQVGSE